jgi:hypothetical protein
MYVCINVSSPALIISTSEPVDQSSRIIYKYYERGANGGHLNNIIFNQ